MLVNPLFWIPYRSPATVIVLAKWSFVWRSQNIKRWPEYGVRQIKRLLIFIEKKAIVSKSRPETLRNIQSSSIQKKLFNYEFTLVSSCLDLIQLPALGPWGKVKNRRREKKKRMRQDREGRERKEGRKEIKNTIFIWGKVNKGKIKCQYNSLFIMWVRDIYFKIWINLLSQVSLLICIHGHACLLLGGFSPDNL